MHFIRSHKALPLAFITIFSLFSGAQTLNESYLQSLPPEIQADVLKNIADETSNDPELYRGPKTTVLQLNSQLEQIKLQLYEIENELGTSDTDSGDLVEFGSTFFKSYQSSFAPLSLPNLSDDYVVGVGDIFHISLIGQVNADLADIPVAKDGSITVAKVGKFSVAGLTLKDATRIIQNNVTKKIVGQEIYLTLADIRDINLLVIGNVEAPGMYTVSGNSNILSVLDMAGGPSSSGSMRSILLKRDGKTIAEFDLYEVFINGNFEVTTELRAGDVILVTPKGHQVAISGGVSQQGIYEIKQGTSLSEALHYSGGLSPSSTQDIIFVERKDTNTALYLEVDITDIDSFILQNGDSIKANFFQAINKAQPSIEIKGQVHNPGIYTVGEMETLSSVIQRAGGYKDDAYSLGGAIYRESTKKVEQKINDKLYQDMIAFLAAAANSSSAASSGALPIILQEFKDAKPLGRLETLFDIDQLQQNPTLDLMLLDGDVINIPPYSPEVFVLGEVMNPGSKYYKPSLSTSDYLGLAGGLGRFAEKRKVIVISPNGDTFLHSSRINFLRDSSQGIYPGSIIYVPRQIGKLDGINYAASIAPIFSNLALSLASLNAISD
jgi:polysaccharide biosynthesis/export protein